MTAPSNANTSGLEYYGFRAFNAGIGVCHLVANPGLNDTNPEPLVTAASAQARIAELEARVAELEAAKWDVKHVDTMNDMVAMGLARDAAEARADRLAKALDTLQDLFAREGECSMERFERLAEMFRKDTGYLAPGKDPGMLSQQPEGEELRRIYDDWFAAKIVSARAALQQEG
ncbi:hypothetical protein [Brevundimonas mediterranea]|uniref:Uncharacterized protein n=1 Tax=Brevundimonas mediterranea TaxID=74329 RepID=A0A7Z8Y2J4_9CAUL|nr:hypothetical protein [Brevundimonas mediterranea]VDC49732.1 hypothetical protein BREV_BREV_01378 [Brevundimonas mediterranea]